MVMDCGLKMAANLIPLLMVFILVAVNAEINKIYTHPTEHTFLDEHGRVRIFHGVNIVRKAFPWYHKYLEEDRRMDDLEKWGFNIVRFGAMWTGTEPERDVFNATYIGVLRDVIQRFEKRGIYTMLDMHQDCLSSKFPPSYDGVPRWLVDSFPEPSNPYPWPLDSVGAWEEGYLTQGVSEGFQQIYNNTNGAMDEWTDFWGFITLNFRDEPSVIGYNLINEPWVGDYFVDEDLLLPGYAGQHNLLPSYDILNERIRQYDTEKILFYEPTFHGQLFHDLDFGSGFDRVPGGPQYRNVSAMSYHMYCWFLEFIPSNATDEEREEAKQACYDELLPTMMRSQAENVNLTGGAAILTEFGLCRTNQNQVNVDCQFYLDLADDYLQSWVAWDYNDNVWHSGEEPIMDRVIHYVRTYAQAIAGEPTSMVFNNSTNDFRLEFDLDPTIDAPTVIYVPALRYPNGFQVSLSPFLRWTAEDSYIHVFHQGDPRATTKQASFVSITPA